jgi:hypothetical protein
MCTSQGRLLVYPAHGSVTLTLDDIRAWTNPTTISVHMYLLHRARSAHGVSEYRGDWRLFVVYALTLTINRGIAVSFKCFINDPYGKT